MDGEKKKVNANYVYLNKTKTVAILSCVQKRLKHFLMSQPQGMPVVISFNNIRPSCLTLIEKSGIMIKYNDKYLEDALMPRVARNAHFTGPFH